MDYRAYEAEDFMLNSSFQNYCLGNNEKDHLFWKNWIQENPGKQAVVQQAKEMYLLLAGGHSAEQFEADKNQFETTFQQHIGLNEAATVKQLPETIAQERGNFRKKIFLYAASAAAVAIIFLLFNPINKQQQQAEQGSLQHYYQKVSNAGERKSFQLPDGSKVMLNAGSTIDICKNFNVNDREVILNGEAFFDVAHNANKPFIIRTRNMDIKVLGTVFNVKAYPADKLSETSLISGSVEVILRNNANKKVLLKPNEKIVLPNTVKNATPATGESRSVKPGVTEEYKIKPLTYDKTAHTLAEVSWTTNKLVFTDDTFEDIAAELERWYNIDIEIFSSQVKQYRFTAVFDQKNVVQVLDALQLSRRFEYTVQENNRIVIGK